MAVYVIADLHLSTDNASKSMDVFGNRWRDYQNKIMSNWKHLIADDDTVIIPGDISWALTLQNSISDIAFINSLPGQKVFMKGNHDFWWTSVTKMKAMFAENNFNSIKVLNNNALEIEDYIITGSRGWFIDPSSQTKNVNADFEKVNNREVIRLKIGLDEAKKLQELSGQNKEIVVFFHFPPVWGDFENRRLIDLLSEYNVKRCYFGHIHGNYNISGTFEVENITFKLISADYLNFVPLHI